VFREMQEFRSKGSYPTSINYGNGRKDESGKIRNEPDKVNPNLINAGAFGAEAVYFEV
jgi:hypothetical protein